MDTPQFQWPDPERFIRLSVQAQQQGITLTPIPRFLKIQAASSSRGGKNYLVDEYTCSCEAGRFGGFCKHRAMYIFFNMTRIVQEHGKPPWKVERGVVVAE